MLRVAIFTATVLAAGCPSHGPTSYPRAEDDTALRIEIARAEAQRAAGVDELAALATSGAAHAQALALRGLGRIGGDRALAIVRAHLGDRDPAVATAAFAALGIAASLDDTAPLADEVAIPAALGPEDLAVVLEAFGRAGAIADQAAILAAAKGQPPQVVAAAALALGRMARRKLTYQPTARQWLSALTTDPDRDVRYAATYALAREHEPIAHESPALAARITDDDPEIRATAIAGLAKRDAAGKARDAIAESLRDTDWRVAVEAVRALAGDHGDAAGRALVANNLERRWHELAAGHGEEAQVVTESLRLLLAHPDGAALPAFAGPLPAHGISPLAGPWIERLAAVVAAEAAHALSPTLFTQGALPGYLRTALAADAYDQGDASFQRAALRALLEDKDPRVRAAGLGVLGHAPRDLHTEAAATIAAALASPDPILAGAAVDAAGTLYAALDDEPAVAGQLAAAILARAARETDPELGSDLYGAIGKAKLAAGEGVCRAGLTAAHPVRARAAAACLKDLGLAVPPPAIAATTPPPVDVADVIGKRLKWHLATSTGELVIELRPDLAPWNVATIVALTRKGFYDGLAFHRVVPDFVVQGGDPTSSGYGGPGFTTPAEPATLRDGPGFAAGGIGIADAGRDSGGSQWFAMHSRAPHLDGRYTYIGRLVGGQKSADSLLIGDVVVKATIEVEP